MKYAIKYFLLAKRDCRLMSRNRKCIVFMAADYGNYGDIAVTQSQINYLKSTLPGYDIIPYNIKDSIYYLKAVVNAIKKDDVITIIGGGNFGDLYLPFEKTRRYIAKKIKKNTIVSFPQSIVFSSEKELKKSLKIYDKSKMVVAVRESKSYNSYKKYFSRMILVPDIVLSNEVKRDTKKGTGKIAFIFRDDKEKAACFSLLSALHDVAKEYGEIHYFDTTFSVVDRFDNQMVLEKFLNKVATYDYIFTDRLHAMIFGYLLNIPTVVIDNSNGKIGSTYKTWLQLSQRIFYIDIQNTWGDSAKKLLINFMEFSHSSKDNADLQDCFHDLTKLLQQQAGIDVKS